jgi:hypothetical protein
VGKEYPFSCKIAIQQLSVFVGGYVDSRIVLQHHCIDGAEALVVLVCFMNHQLKQVVTEYKMEVCIDIH